MAPGAADMFDELLELFDTSVSYRTAGTAA